MPAGEPTTWQIVAKVAELLGAVRIANGYYTDFGVKVRTGKYTPQEGEGAHAVVVAGDMPVTTTGNRTRSRSIDLLIECRVPASASDADLVAHRALDDVLHVIPARQREIEWPARSGGLEVIGARILDRPQGVAFVVAQVTARAGLVETSVARVPV